MFRERVPSEAPRQPTLTPKPKEATLHLCRPKTTYINALHSSSKPVSKTTNYLRLIFQSTLRKPVQPLMRMSPSSATRFLRSLSSMAEKREDHGLLQLQSSELHDRHRAVQVPLRSAADERRESEMMEAVVLPRLHQDYVSRTLPVLVSYLSQ